MYGVSGLPQGEAFLVNQETYHHQNNPSITALQDGGFVATWQDYSHVNNTGDTNNYGVSGQRFDASGVRLGEQFDINTYTTGAQLEPSVAAHGDGFVVTWTDHSGSSGSRGGSGYDILSLIHI